MQNRRGMNLDVRVNDLPLGRSSSAKLLGVILDECMLWREHCERLISSLGSVCYLIRHLRTVLSEEMLRSYYFAHVESRISYAIVLWGSASMVGDVFISQKRIIRCMAGVDPNHSCRQLFKEFGILTVCGLYLFHLLVFIFRHRSSLSTCGDFHDYQTRHRHNLLVPKHRLQITGKGPVIAGTKFFNKLPDRIKALTNERDFRKEIKIMLTQEPLYRLDEFCIAH